MALRPPVKLLLCVYSVPVGRPGPWASAVKCRLVARRPAPGALVAGVGVRVLGAAACVLSLDAGALAGMGRWVSVGFVVLVCRVAGAVGALAGSGGIPSLVLVGFLVLVCWSAIAVGALAGSGGGPSVAPVGFFVLVCLSAVAAGALAGSGGGLSCCLLSPPPLFCRLACRVACVAVCPASMPSPPPCFRFCVSPARRAEDEGGRGWVSEAAVVVGKSPAAIVHGRLLALASLCAPVSPPSVVAVAVAVLPAVAGLHLAKGVAVAVPVAAAVAFSCAR